MSVSVSGVMPGNTNPFSETTSCTVQSNDVTDGVRSLQLQCDSGARGIDVTDLGSLSVGVGDQVDLTLFVYAPWWTDTWVKVEANGVVVLAAMDAEALPGWGDPEFPAADFFAPLQVTELTDVCDPEPLSDAPCHATICPETCTQDQRVALQFDDGSSDSATVYDRGTGALGDLGITVGSAVHHVQVLCSDTPNDSFAFVAMQ